MKLFIPAVIISCFLLSCSQNNVKEDKNLNKYFDENKVYGSFALMDNGTGKFTVHGLKRYRDSSFLPASTFKIVNSLIGLQTGKISNDSMIIKWDGIKRKPEWDQDMSMYRAFRVSAVPWFQEVARRIGRDTMQIWLDSLKYGTKSLRSEVDTFWLDNTLKITADEELGLVKRLYFDQLPFFKTYQETVKTAMLLENNANYRLGYKTGWGFTDNDHALGWVVGWIEENNHPYFFELNIESPDRNYDMSIVRVKMLKDILGHLGFFKGKM